MKYILKGQYGFGFPVITVSPKEYLNKGAEVLLKAMEPVGKAVTKVVAALPSSGPTAMPYFPTTVEEVNRERENLKMREKVFEEDIAPALSPSNHVVAWTQGSMNPKVGQRKIAEWGPLALLASLGADMVGFKYAPKGVKATTRGTKAAVTKAVKNSKVKEVSKTIDKVVDEGFTPRLSSDKNLYRTTTDKEVSALKSGRFEVHPNGGNHGVYGWRRGEPFYQPGSMVESKMVGKRNGLSGVKDPTYLVAPVKEDLQVRIGSGGKYSEPVPATEVESGTHAYYHPSGGLAYDNSSIGFLPGDKLPNGIVAWSKKNGKWRFEPILLPKTILFEAPKLTEPRTSLKFFERKPFNSKLKKSEEAGVPKGERNNKQHGQALAPYYDYSLINKHYEPWTVNEKGQFVFASPEESEKLGTIHFSMNEPVMDHFMGSWGDAPTVTVMPYRNMRSQTPPVDIAIMDTFFPNYKGLKVSSRGSRTLTGDKATYDYYKSKGIDVEFSPEMESLLNEMKDVRSKLDSFTEQEKYGFPPNKDAKALLDREYQLKEQIDEVSRKWARNNVKTIPNFEKLDEFGRAEGLDMDSYPYQLGSTGPMTTRASRELGLDYTWQSDPSNHSVFLQNPEYLLKQIERGEYGKVRPEYIKYLKWAIKHKADYRVNPLETLEGFGEFDGRTTLGNIQGFIDNDIIPRLKEQGHQIESYTPNIRSADFLNDIFDLKMRGENAGAWFSPATNEVTLRGPLENQDFGLVVHEAGGHGIRYNMLSDYKPVSREIINKYLTNPEDPTVLEPLLNSHFGREVFNNFEVTTLGDAYPEIAGYFENFTNRLSGQKLSPEALAKRILDELGAVNTQFRAKLSENGRLTGKALDKKIQETPEGVILRMEIEQGYTSMGILERISKITGVSMDALNFYNPASLQKLVQRFPELKVMADKVKYAMTHVAVGSGVMYGLNQYGMKNEKNK